MPTKKIVTWSVHFAFCVPGVIAVALMQWEDYHGLGGNANKPYSRTTALPVLPAFCSNLLALPLLFRHHWTEMAEPIPPAQRNATMLRRLYDPRMFIIAICAIVGEIANQSSIILAGSLTFTVVYSSVTIWTALFGIPLLHKAPNRIQWGALITIVFGLIFSAMSHTAHRDLALVPKSNLSSSTGNANAEEQPAGSSIDFVFGAGFGMLGSIAYAVMYVMTEKVQKAADAPPPEALCVFVGMVGTAVLLLYIVVWDGPSWVDLVTSSLTGSYYEIVSVYLAICICCFLHNLAFYYLTRLSAVMAGINKAVQAVSVFALSHMCYCDIDAQQCLTPGKLVAMVLVVLGVLLFSIGKKWGQTNPVQNIGMPDLNESIDEADGFRISDVTSYKRLSAAGAERGDWAPSEIEQTSFAGTSKQDNAAEQSEVVDTLQTVVSKEQGLLAMTSAQ